MSDNPKKLHVRTYAVAGSLQGADAPLLDTFCHSKNWRYQSTPVMTIAYEQLQADVAGTMAKLVGFLGLTLPRGGTVGDGGGGGGDGAGGINTKEGGVKAGKEDLRQTLVHFDAIEAHGPRCLDQLRATLPHYFPPVQQSKRRRQEIAHGESKTKNRRKCR